MKALLPFLLFALLALTACDEGNPLDNQLPNTRIFLDNISLSGEARLNSVVQMHWSGEDRDGYIKGYELSFDNSSWSFVTNQDSTFRFPINPGSDTNNIDFWVRAIDNEDGADPSPAYLSVPIKNAPPVATLDTVKLIPDTVYSVFSTLWTIGDLDGDETLDSLFIRINDGAWFYLPVTASFVTIVPENPMQAGEQGGRVYIGSSPNAIPQLIEGLRVADDNRIYLRVNDIAGSFSEIDSTKRFFIRTQTAELLLIDDHNNAAADDVMVPLFNEVSQGQFDYFRLVDNIPPFWDPTFGKLLEIYDQVFWYGDGLEQGAFGNQLFLEIAANQIQLYLNQGGKVFISTALPSSFTTPERNGISSIFSFSPMDSVSSSGGQPRIVTDSLLRPSAAFSEFPALVSASFIIGADPFYAKDPSNILYDAGITPTGGWTGPRTAAGRTVGAEGRTNQVFFSVELYRFNKDPDALKQMVDRVLNVEFDW
jgi:hypothetical protein